MTLVRIAAVCALAAFPWPALAQAPQEPPLCTDRPTRANAVCTVPKGEVQIEADVFSYARLPTRR